MTAAVTPLEALRRMYDVARKVDASESGEFETLLQGELAVAESVLRDAAVPSVTDILADGERLGKILKLTADAKALFSDDGSVRELVLLFRPAVEATGNCQKTVRELIDKMHIPKSLPVRIVGKDDLSVSLAANTSSSSTAAPVVPVAAQPVVPEGWQLVPTKLTDDMIVAFAERWYSHKQVIDDPEMGDAYASMLAVAPSLEAQPAGEVVDQRVRFEEWAKRTHTRPGTHFNRSHNGVYTDNRIAAKWAAWSAAMAQGDKA